MQVPPRRATRPLVSIRQLSTFTVAVGTLLRNGWSATVYVSTFGKSVVGNSLRTLWAGFARNSLIALETEVIVERVLQAILRSHWDESSLGGRDSKEIIDRFGDESSLGGLYKKSFDRIGGESTSGAGCTQVHKIDRSYMRILWVNCIRSCLIGFRRSWRSL